MVATAAQTKKVFLLLPPVLKGLQSSDVRTSVTNYAFECSVLKKCGLDEITDDIALSNCCQEVWYSSQHGLTDEMQQIIGRAESSGIPVVEHWTVNANASHMDIYNLLLGKQSRIYPVPECFVNDGQDERVKKTMTNFFGLFAQEIASADSLVKKQISMVGSPLTKELIISVFEYYEQQYVKKRVPEVASADFRYSLDFYNANIGKKPRLQTAPSSFKEYLVSGVCRYLSLCV